jgi:hypothetical protein
MSQSRRWLAVLAACGLIFQGVVSGLALGACALADEPHTASHLLAPSAEAPYGSGGHHHRGGPVCCFFALHFLSGKVVPPSAEIALAPADPMPAGLTGPERGRHGDPGHERQPQNPRAPPLPV